jgi:hypothetical protein
MIQAFCVSVKGTDRRSTDITTATATSPPIATSETITGGYFMARMQS